VLQAAMQSAGLLCKSDRLPLFIDYDLFDGIPCFYWKTMFLLESHLFPEIPTFASKITWQN
jgi:hypothetical protein